MERIRVTSDMGAIIGPIWFAGWLFTLGFAGLAIGTAWLAWRFIEEPARHWTRRFAPPSGGPPVPAI